MAIREHDWDEDLRRRAKEEDCPIPQGFEKRLEARLEELPQGAGRPGRRWKSALVLAAAALTLTACVGATAVAVITQTRNHYFEDPEEAADAATQAALESGSDTAGVAYAPEEMSDYPAPEALDVEDVMSRMDQILAYEEGGPEDGWTLMFSGEDELTRDTYYVADSLSALERFWPAGTPDLEWLDANCTPVPGAQYYAEQVGINDGADISVFTYDYLEGEYQTAAGDPFNLSWTFHPNWESSDQFTVLGGIDRVEDYTAADGAVVTIEWYTTVSGQSRCFAGFEYPHVTFSLSGAGLEPEEVREILDHMNLFALRAFEEG